MCNILTCKDCNLVPEERIGQLKNKFGILTQSTGTYLRCPQCHRRSDVFESKEDSITHWNVLNERKLKPCPKCGGDIEIVCIGGGWFWRHIDSQADCILAHSKKYDTREIVERLWEGEPAKEWEIDTFILDSRSEFVCPHCGYRPRFKRWEHYDFHFCPKCGKPLKIPKVSNRCENP